jgi:hypothetical protein
MKVRLICILAGSLLVCNPVVAEARAGGWYGSNKECSAWRRAGNASSVANAIWAVLGLFQDIDFWCDGPLYT